MNPIIEVKDIWNNYILVNLKYVVSIQIIEEMYNSNRKLYNVSTQKDKFVLDKEYGQIIYKKYREYGQQKEKQNEPSSKYTKIHRVSW